MPRARPRATPGGRSQGKGQGQGKSLKRLLTRRFGPLPTRAEQRIDTAPFEQLDAWLDGIFDAPSLEDLLGNHAG